MLQERHAIEFEETADFGDGVQTFLSSKFPLLDSEGDAYAVCGMATDITERKRLEEALSSAALAVSESEEVTLYRELTRYLSTILGVDGAFIATLMPGDPSMLHMLAFHLDGRVLENFAYPQSGTPCETVLADGCRFYSAQLGDLFPLDEDFRKFGLESYAGHPLVDRQGRSVGLIAVISRRPLLRMAFVESVLRIFSVRVNAELERDAAATALRASEANYRQIFETSEDAIYVHDWDTGALVDANPRACEQRGYSREELLRVPVSDLVANDPPYTADEALRRIAQAKRDGSLSFEWRSRNRDGHLRWDEVRLKSAQIGGQPRILAFVRDITERKEAEDALSASEEQYRTIFNASIDALMLKDEDHSIVDVNAAYLAMHGYPRDALIGKSLAEFIPAELQKQCDRLLTEVLRGQSCHLEAQSRRADGSTFDVEIHGVPMQYRGRPHALMMMRDLTEQRRAERARMELEAQLRQAQKMEAIGQLAGGIAHDFNNLLTSIMGYVALASERDSTLRDPKLVNYLSQAQQSCARARDLIQQMLMFSRGHRGSPRTVALASVVRGALGTLQLGLPATLDLSVDADETAGNVLVDPAQVEQVLMNLCINARDATDGLGRLRLSVRRLHAENLVCASCRRAIDGRFVEMVVEDDGHGMGPEVLERIFEPFFSTKETGKGTGMGLAMVHGIVHEHGGHVVVESSPGQGATFRVLWREAPGGARQRPWRGRWSSATCAAPFADGPRPGGRRRGDGRRIHARTARYVGPAGDQRCAAGVGTRSGAGSTAPIRRRDHGPVHAADHGAGTGTAAARNPIRPSGHPVYGLR